MEVLHAGGAPGWMSTRRCVNASARASRRVGRSPTEHREFDLGAVRTTAGLVALAAWLTEVPAVCTHVAILPEATGVYCSRTVWHVLEDEASLTLVLANARHIRNVPAAQERPERPGPGRSPTCWRSGLIRGSASVPPAPIQELRDLTRTRKQLGREIARHTQRLQKALEDANVKLTRVVARHPGRQRPGSSWRRSSPGRPIPSGGPIARPGA